MRMHQAHRAETGMRKENGLLGALVPQTLEREGPAHTAAACTDLCGLHSVIRGPHSEKQELLYTALEAPFCFGIHSHSHSTIYMLTPLALISGVHLGCNKPSLMSFIPGVGKMQHLFRLLDSPSVFMPTWEDKTMGPDQVPDGHIHLTHLGTSVRSLPGNTGSHRREAWILL